ncbi:histidine phosphatase family protein, partial [Algibacter sp.]|uniref:histidine phosphatase family protein n=1 Tax=Algibacter sp. TaxID=1872428 RepID=UPI003C78BAA5
MSSCKNKTGVNSETESQVNHFYFVRHAEKDRSNPDNDNPKLTDTGVSRAKLLNTILENVKFHAVYSTNYFRTIETAKP